MPAQLPATLQRFQDRILVVIGVVVLFWIWHLAHLEWGTERYVASWMDERIWIFAAVAVLLAGFGLVRSALGATFGYPLVVIVGEVLGSVAWDAQEMFLGEDHEPIHAGWWIAVGLFVWVVLLSAWGDWRARRWARIEEQEKEEIQHGLG